MISSVSILGSTGSIGLQALDVARNLNLNVTAIAAHSNIDLLENQIREFSPKIATVFDYKKAKELKIRVADTDTKVLSGMDGLLEIAAEKDADILLNSVVGMIGLEPTLLAAKSKKNIALANKETLVAGGQLVMQTVQDNGVKLYPVDSEHSAIFQCLQASPSDKAIKKLILTASGGPFFGKTAEELKSVTAKQALAHPTWNMGAKITIDSATMMNKGLEVIEASWLFNMTYDKIDVVIHRESIIHSLIEFTDNAVLAQLGTPDMRVPIQYALTYPDRLPSPAGELNLAQIGNLSFYEPDYGAFPCLKTCINSIKRGGLAPAAANGANEVANELFRKGKITFTQIGEIVNSAMLNQPNIDNYTLEDVLNADKIAREYVYNLIK